MSRDVDAVTPVTTVRAGKEPPVGSMLLGKYRVEATLGFGGSGLVIRAANTALGESVAIKLMRSDVQLDREHVERFIREAKAAVRLMSEHVAKIRDVGILEDGRPYIIMELLEGADLGKVIADGGALPRTRSVDLVLQACDAIAEAHALGIVHRDIKPTNLFVTRRHDGSELLKVLDFGISKAQSGAEMSLTQTSSMLGTPAYMSPEQMRSARSVDPRSDIWALGTVLYETVEGRLPFAADNFAELCVAVATELPRPLERAPELIDVLTRCLAKSLVDRFQNVGELALALEPFASDPKVAARQVRRILRVLGTSQPSPEDGPLPPTRTRPPRPGSASELPPTRNPRVATAPTPVLPAAVAELPPTRAARVGTPAQGVATPSSAASPSAPAERASRPSELPPARGARPSAPAFSPIQPSALAGAIPTRARYAEGADTIREGVPAIVDSEPATGAVPTTAPQLGAVLRESAAVIATPVPDSGPVPQPLAAAPSDGVPHARSGRYDSRSTATHTAPSMWKTIAIFVLLFAIGIAAGLFVTSRSESVDTPGDAATP